MWTGGSDSLRVVVIPSVCPKVRPLAPCDRPLGVDSEIIILSPLGNRSRSLWFFLEFASASSAWGVMGVGGESRAHDIASWLYPIDPSSRGGKGYHRCIRIKKANKQFVRAGCGTRPSRERERVGLRAELSAAVNGESVTVSTPRALPF